MSTLLYKAGTFKIIGSCMEVHKQLGRGFSENIYKDALQVEFRRQNIPFQREQKYIVQYKDEVLEHFYFADFVVFDKIILELKAVSGLSDAHVAQTLNYLKVSGCRVELLLTSTITDWITSDLSAELRASRNDTFGFNHKDTKHTVINYRGCKPA